LRGAVPPRMFSLLYHQGVKTATELAPMMNRLAAALGLALVAISHQTYAGVVDRARALRWSVQNETAMQKIFHDIGVVNEFLRSVASGDGVDGSPPLANAFTFADLLGDGHIELVCTISDGGQSFPTVLVVAKSGNGFTRTSAYTGGAMEVPDFDKILISADGGKQKQILLPRWLKGYPGAFPGPIVYDIYQYAYGKLKRADQQYAAYYRSVLLPKLAAQVASLRAAQPSGDVENDHQRIAKISALEESIEAMREMLRTGVVPEFHYDAHPAKQ
jgi:hypothetical protein